MNACKEKWLVKGTTAKYKKLGMDVTILDVHHDPEGTYYTIALPDGGERGTTMKNLSLNCTENIPRIFTHETDDRILDALFTKKILCEHMKRLNCYHSSFLKKSMVRFLTKYYQKNE